jgi:hypothetical protein
MSPTTTPAAIPALLAPPDDPLPAAAVALAVTTTVCPFTVTTDWVADAVVEGEVLEVDEGVDPSALTFEIVPSRLSAVR